MQRDYFLNLTAELKQTAGYLYMATEIVASGLGVGKASAQRPEHTYKYVRIASTARPRTRIAE